MEHKITAFILAGGRSSRFNGDKALSGYRGNPLITYPAKRLFRLFEDLVIIAKDSSSYHHLGFPVIEDELPFQTPLAGIYTGLRYTQTDWNFFLACDMPLITEEVIQKLVGAIPPGSDDLEIIIPRTPHHLQPLAGLYHRSLADIFMETAENIRSVKGFVRSRRNKIIDFDSVRPFTNVNTKEDLEKIDIIKEMDGSRDA